MEEGMDIVNAFDFHLSTRISFGIGAARSAGKELASNGVKMALIVTDAGILGADILHPIEKSLDDAHIRYKVFSDVASNPTAENIHKGAALMASGGYEAILAIGGGSSLDTAKGIVASVALGGNILDHEGWVEIPGSPPPILAIPTTAGTGSEVSLWAVVSDVKTHRKIAIGSTKIAPILAILDPEMTYSLPKHLTAYTGLDALTHAIEAYTSKLANPLSDGLAFAAIKHIGSSLIRAYQSPRDKTARSNMLVASAMAAMAFNMADLGAAHSIAEAIGGLYNLHHGLACGASLPDVIAYNTVAAPEKFADIALALGRQDGDAYAAITHLTSSMEIPMLNQTGIRKEDVAWLAKSAAENIATPNNPRSISEDDFLQIFTRAAS
jgi:alcohol dehydrogenase class IV